MLSVSQESPLLALPARGGGAPCCCTSCSQTPLLVAAAAVAATVEDEAAVASLSPEGPPSIRSFSVSSIRPPVSDVACAEVITVEDEDSPPVAAAAAACACAAVPAPKGFTAAGDAATKGPTGLPSNDE